MDQKRTPLILPLFFFIALPGTCFSLPCSVFREGHRLQHLRKPRLLAPSPARRNASNRAPVAVRHGGRVRNSTRGGAHLAEDPASGACATSRSKLKALAKARHAATRLWCFGMRRTSGRERRCRPSRPWQTTLASGTSGTGCLHTFRWG